MELGVADGIKSAIHEIRSKLDSGKAPVLVCIGGGSGSGKTSIVAKRISEALGKSAMIIPMDDYFKGKKFVEDEVAKGREMNRDHPEYVDMEKLSEDLDLLKQNVGIQKPVFDYRESRRSGYVTVSPSRVIIIEGLFALHDSIGGMGDLRIFVAAGKEERLRRILKRKRHIRGTTSAEMLDYFHRVIDPMHVRYVEPTRKSADIVIRN